MQPIERLYKKDEIVPRSLHIEEQLYLKIQELSENGGYINGLPLKICYSDSDNAQKKIFNEWDNFYYNNFNNIKLYK